MAIRGWVLSLALGLAGLLSLAANPARADGLRLAISGYDPVAYFTDNKPVAGQDQFEYQWHNLRWYFASAAHRALFVHDPEHYAPQYDGYCAVGVEVHPAHKDTVDPKAWAIVNGKLYLTHNLHWLSVWRENTADNIKRGDENWPSVSKQTVLYDGFPHVFGTPQQSSPVNSSTPTTHG
jgi:hypothetical protein